ncbi:MAG: hypothetical protein ACYS7M_04050 [Planctomycetota bacterium]
MLLCKPATRQIRPIAAVLLAAAGCGTMTGGTGGGSAANPDEENGGQNGADPEPVYIARNEGGGDLALRMGGATFTGQATGPLASGTLTLTFDVDGILRSLGGTVLASFFGFPEGSEVVFDYLSRTVTGTHVAPDSAPRTLAEFLAESGQALQLRQIVVTLTGDTFTARTVYEAELAGRLTGEQAITVAATLRFDSNDALTGTLQLPGYRDDQEPLFNLDRF